MASEAARTPQAHMDPHSVGIRTDAAENEAKNVSNESADLKLTQCTQNQGA